jgi:glycosyltransferase involved in cell wall biosynthesis
MADEIVLVNERLRQQLGLSAPCPIIPAAVDLDRFRPMDPADARQRLGIDSQVPVVLFPSDAAHRGFGKGFDLLERALQELQESVQLLVGGTIPPDQMPLYINAADVVVQTSRYESGPIVVKEAMACSKPIVSTDVGDVQWLFGGLPGHFISDSEPGPIAGAISRALRFRGPTSGRSRLKDLGLTLQETAEKYLDIYEHVLHRQAFAQSR